MKGTHETYVKTKENYLSKNAHLLSKKSFDATKAYNDNEKIKNKAFDEYTLAGKTYETQCKDSYALMLAQKEVCNEIRSRLEEEQTDAGSQNLKTLKEQLQENNSLNLKLELLNLL